ncbi:MAG: flavin reductase [Phycisphaerae bacterium]|nr:flavin reductase [Phycisphaerae bacterium]
MRPAGRDEPAAPRAEVRPAASAPTAANGIRNGHANGNGNGHAASAVTTDPRAAAAANIPHGHFILTASYGDAHGGVVVRWVQQVSSSPILVVVAIEKGQPLSPIIRDSRRFVLCQLAPEDRVLRRLFSSDRDDGHDPFLGLSTMRAPGGPPVLLRAQSWLDCELTRHLDVEGNCELYIGLVHAGGVLKPGATPEAAG